MIFAFVFVFVFERLAGNDSCLLCKGPFTRYDCDCDVFSITADGLHWIECQCSEGTIARM